jgi:DNA-binding IclR family transcriptional regulator
VRAVERAAALLKAFSPEHSRLTLTELARATALDKGTARRLLHTLAAVDFIHVDQQSQTYALGAAVLMLAPAVSVGGDLREIAAPFLTRIAETTGATAFLWVYHQGEALCIDRVRARSLHIDTPWATIGGRIGLNYAGGARTLLAYIDAAERERVLAGPLTPLTPFTQTDPAALRADSAAIRARGWVLAVDDYVVGLAGLGVPIFDRNGAFVASLSITTLTSRLVREDGSPRYLDSLIDAAAEIGASLQP